MIIKDPVGFNKNWLFFSKKFIACNFFSRRDTNNLKTPLHVSRRDASKHISADLEKSGLKFDPRSGLLTLTHYIHILWPYRKYVESKFKNCFPTHWGIWYKNPAGTPCKYKKSVLAPPPPNGDKTPPYIPDFTDTVIYLHEQFLSLAAPEIQEGIDMSRFPDENAQFCERIFWQSDFNFVWLRL